MASARGAADRPIASEPAPAPASAPRASHSAGGASAEDRERLEAAQRLVERERAVAAELNQFAHGLRIVAAAQRDKSGAASPERVRRALRKLTRRIEACDDNWLAGITLELVEALETWRPSNAAHAASRVDRFLNSTRAALAALRRRATRLEAESR